MRIENFLTVYKNIEKKKIIYQLLYLTRCDSLIQIQQFYPREIRELLEILGELDIHRNCVQITRKTYWD